MGAWRSRNCWTRVRRCTALVGSPAAARLGSSESSMKTVSHKSNETVLIGLAMSPFLSLHVQIQLPENGSVWIVNLVLCLPGPFTGCARNFPERGASYTRWQER